MFFNLALCMILAIALGCSDSNDRDIQQRLDRTIHELLTNNTKDGDINAALALATPKTLENPTIVYVRADTRSPTAVVLYVHWIEKYPTPNALLLRSSKTGYQKVFTFDQEDIDEQNRDAKAYVLFYSVWRLEYPSEEWKALEQQLQEGEVEAVLLRDGTPVSNIMKVELRQKDTTSSPNTP